MRKIFVFIITMVSVFAFSQGAPPKLYSKFEFITVKGKVLTRAGNPVPNVKVNIFQQSDGTGVFGNVNTIENSADTTSMPKVAWARTNDKGEFVLKGVPMPGGYYLEVKGVTGFKKAQYPLRIDAGSGFEIVYPVIYLDKYFKIDSETKKQLNKMNKEFEKGNLNESAEIAKDIIVKQKNLPDPYIILGNYFLKSNEPKSALRYYNLAIANGVDNPEVFKTAAKVSFSIKDLSGVISYLLRGADAGLEKDLSYYQMLFQAYYLSGDKPMAKKTLREMLENFKDFKNREKLANLLKEMK